MGKHKKVTKEQHGLIQQWILAYTFKKPPIQGKDYIGPWELYPESKNNPVYRIKRFIKYKDGGSTWQRLKLNFYEEYLTNNREIERLLIWLNGRDPEEMRAGIKFRVKKAYIPSKHLEDFLKDTKNNFANEDKKEIKSRLNSFQKYGLEWFQKKEVNPLKWKLYDKEWGICLLNLNPEISNESRIIPAQELRSRNTIKRIIWMMNKFLEYLNDVEPNKYPLITLNPLSRSQLASLEFERKTRNMIRIRGHIREIDWDIIKVHIRKDPELSILELCYEFGLRRNEALYVREDSLCIDNLNVSHQIKGDFSRLESKLPKQNSARRIPYSVSEMSRTHLIKIMRENEKSNASPAQINFKWRDLMNELGFDYDIHDCRHSFCRRIVRNHDIKMAMEFCGHKSVETTNGYLQSKTEYNHQKLLMPA